MALPSSGPISLSQVSVELDASATSTRSLNEASTRELFEVPSGAISLSDGYGKANVFVLNITANATNVNIRSLAVSAGWNLNSKVSVNIAADVYISSNNASTPALSITGSFPNGAELTNNGIVIGMGGAGGAGGNAAYGPLEVDGTAGGGGSGGGSALFTTVATAVTNNGSLIGGGGGGGGGASRNDEGSGDYNGYAGGGGGGGRSNLTLNSAGGAAGLYNRGGNSPVAGTAGTSAAAGVGGAGGGVGSPIAAGNGGNGGDLGQAGTSGTAGGGGAYVSKAVGGGGAAGASASGDTYITWVATGTRIGPVVA